MIFMIYKITMKILKKITKMKNILKNFVPLQSINKSSDYFGFASETSAISKATRISNNIRSNAGLFLVKMVAEDLRSGRKSAIFVKKVKISYKFK